MTPASVYFSSIDKELYTKSKIVQKEDCYAELFPQGIRTMRHLPITETGILIAD